MATQIHFGNPKHIVKKGESMTPEERTSLIKDIAEKVLQVMLANPHIAATATTAEVTAIVTSECQHLKTEGAINTASVIAEVKRGKFI